MTLRNLLLTCTLVGSMAICGTAIAQSLTQLQGLGKELADRLKPFDALPKGLIDCSRISIPILESAPSSRSSQWIYNGMYSWRVAKIDAGACVFLDQPEHRGLTREEAQILLSGSKAQFPIDPKIIASRQAYSDWVAAAMSFGGAASDEAGSLNGYPYRIQYTGTDDSLSRLDIAQHRFADEEKQILARLHHPGSSGDAVDSTTALDLEFSPGGRTKELVVLLVKGHRLSPDGHTEATNENWMLHIPSGRLVTSDDLFADPQAAREHISAAYRRGIPSSMRFYVVLNDEHKQRDFYAAYEKAAAEASTPVPEHFHYLTISDVDPSHPILIIHFSQQSLMPGVPDQPLMLLRGEGLRDLLKPEFRSAFDGIFPPDASDSSR